MDFDQASLAYRPIREFAGRNPSRLGLFTELQLTAVRYAQARANWQLAAPDERARMDQHRTTLHNAFIDACNAMSRAMASATESVSWRERLGDDRRLIGDFACYLHCILALNAR